MSTHKQRHFRRRLWQSLALASALWLGSSVTGGPEPLNPNGQTAEASDGRKRVAAYVYDRASLSLRDSDANKLDQLNYSFALIKNGRVSGSHWQSIGAFKAFIQKHPHILPVMSIGGWGADGFSQAAATAEGRATFAESTIELMEKHGFLGVDIDWEYPGSKAAGIAASSDDRANFTLLLRELRDRLDALTAADGKPRTLAIALGALPSLTGNIECAAVGKLVDQVNLMTYDLQTSGVVSHHTPLYGSGSYSLSVDEAVRAFVNAGIPRQKIMIGAAFYARTFSFPQGTSEPLFTKSSDTGASTLTYTRLLGKVTNSWTLGYDESAQAAYAISGNTFYTYDNERSIINKGRYVQSNGLMGMMCWEYGGDSGGSLLGAMRDGVGN